MSINYVDPSTGSLTPIAGTPTKVVNSISNPNLLDNPWFTVNQRGQSTYTAYGYTFDRWHNNSSSNYISVSEDTNGMHLVQTAASSNGFLRQIFENPLPPGIYTISANVISISGRFIIQCQYDDGTYSNFPTFTTTGITSSTINTGEKNITRIFFQTYSGTDAVIRAVKLELGSVSTLANDVAPNYQQELAKCQRYYYEINNNDGTIWMPLGVIHFRSNNQADWMIRLPVEMRTAPAVTFSDVAGATINYFVSGGTDIAISSITLNTANTKAVGMLINTSAVANPNACGDFWLQPTVSTKITFSADL